MRRALPNLLLAFTTSVALALFLVLFYNNWYFAGSYLVKWLLLALLLTPIYALLLRGAWRPLWLALGIYWTLLVGVFTLAAPHFDLAQLGFTAVLNLEVPMVWLPTAAVIVYACLQAWRRSGIDVAGKRREARALELRRRLRRKKWNRAPVAAALAAVSGVAASAAPESESGFYDLVDED